MTSDQTLSAMYGPGARDLQDAFDSRRLADRLIDLTLHSELNDDDIALVGDQSSLLLATVDAEGWPDVSYKGGVPGFIKVIGRNELQFASFDGNGMFRSLGNIVDTAKVAILFVDTVRPWRMRVHGTAVVSTDQADLDRFHGAQAVVKVTIGRIFPNCGRYVHSGTEISPYVPQQGHEPPDPSWKALPMIRDVLPASDLERIENAERQA